MADDKMLPNVKEALRKDGWALEDTALCIRSDSYYYLIDLEARKNDQKILIEVKSWLSTSFNPDWFMAVGQYISHQEAIAVEELDYKLYLAVPEDVYVEKFGNQFMQDLITKNSINLLIFDRNSNTGVTWK
jgi:hypothetical protein